MRSFIFPPLFCLLALPAGAQTDDAVVVTATRFTQPLSEAPIGVRIISAADIAASGASTVPELLSKFAGMHVRDNSGSPDKQIDLRGFGITSDQNTLVLVDGVRINQNDIASTRLSTIPLQAIERIEILPSGGAVPYGAGATGGTVHIITRGPERGERSALASATAGSYHLRDLRASAGFSGERVALTLHGSHLETEGYRQNNRLRQDSVLGDLRWGDAAAHLGFRFGSDWQRLRLPAERDEVQLVNDRRGTRTPNDYSYRDGDSSTLYGRYVAGRVEFAANLSYRSQTSAIFNDGGFPLFGETRLSDTVFSPRVRIALEPFGVRSSLVAGIDAGEGDLTRRIAGNPAGLSSPFAVNTASQHSNALYLQYQANFSTGTRVGAGVRSQRVTDRVQTESIFGAPTDLERKRKLRAGDLALRQDLGGGFALLARAATSFRVATVDDNGQTDTGQLLEPQTAAHRDLGVEYARPGLQLRAGLYRIELENEIYFSPLAFAAGSFFPGANVNLSPTRRTGAEFSGSWSATRALEVSGYLNLQSAKFRSGVYGGTDVSGRDVPLVPRKLAALRASWRVTPPAQLHGALRYVGTQRYDNDQANQFPRRMPSYTVADLQASYLYGAWRFSAGVKNLFDKQYFSYGIINTFLCATPSCAYPEAGRTAYASAELRL